LLAHHTDVAPLAGEGAERQLAGGCAGAVARHARHTCRVRDSREPEHGIRRMTVEDCPTVSRARARAFSHDPLQVWALRDPATRLSILEQVFELLSRYSSVPRGESYTDTTLACAAFRRPPRPFWLDRA